MYEFKIYLKPEDIHIDIGRDVETRFGTSSYKVNRPLPKGKNKVIGLMKDELGEIIRTEFAALRPKIYSYLADDNNKNKKSRKHEKCFIKWQFKFENYKHCLEANQLEDKISLLENKESLCK